jgi:prevent-host-death family protein
MTDFPLPGDAMQHKRDVRPITYLKNNTSDLIREVSENGRTVLITQNGEAKAVVMDVEVYDRWKSALAMLKILAQSEAELEAGKVVTQKDAFASAEAAVRRIERDGRG